MADEKATAFDLLGADKPAEPREEKSAETVVTVTEEATKPVERADNAGRIGRNYNHVTISGTIKQSTHNKDVTTARITLNSKATMTVSYNPYVYFFDADMAKKAAEFKEGEHVRIQGYIQAYDESRLKKGQDKYVIVGTSISADASETEKSAYEDEGLLPIEGVVRGDTNRFELRGRIEEIKCRRGDDIRITIRIMHGARENVIEFPYVARNTDRFLSNVHVHEYVGAVGTIQTSMVPLDSEAESAAEQTADATIRKISPRPYIRTRSQQTFVLYELYALNPKK